jgi:PAS domain S-box-containing protein
MRIGTLGRSLRLRQSLRLRLPVLIALLIAAVLTVDLFFSYLEVRAALVRAGAARAQAAATHLASWIAETAQRTGLQEEQFAADPRVIDYLRTFAPDSGVGAAIGHRSGDVWIDAAGTPRRPPIDLSVAGVHQYGDGDAARLGAVAFIENTPWAAWVEFPLATLLQPAERVLTRLALFGALFLVVATGVVIVATTRLTAPLLDLADAATRIGQGDFSARITSTRTDEVGRLAAAFNAMASELRNASTALHRSQAHTSFALESTRMGIWETDLTADRLVWSESMARLFNVELDRAPRTRKEFLALIHPEDRGEVDETMDRTMRERREHLRLDYRRIADDGSAHWIEANARVFYGPDGQPLNLIGAAADVTERKMLETQLRQAQKMEAIGQLAGGVAHDFNNLLTAILGYAKLLSESLPAGDARRADVEQIHEAAERASGLTRQLLAFSRQQILQPTVIDLNTLVNGTITMLRRLIGEHITLATNLSPALGPVMADRTQIEQVVINLVVNARDAMPRGGTLSIATADAELDEAYAAAHHVKVQPGQYVMLAVSDTGIGMEEQVRRRIFEPFFTTKERGKGTGLGLATVYGIVKQSGGFIWVYSEPGRGSSFKVYLPRAENTVETAPATPPGPARIRRPTEKVLIVEDEAAVRFLTRLLLERAGYRVMDAANARVAAPMCTDDVDLLITDVVMPDGTGPELFATLSARFPRLRVLFMSGYTDDMVSREGKLAADRPFLQKPFSNEALLRKVREVLDR